MSCAGNGYLTGNKLVAFPFEDDQFLPWGTSVDRAAAQMALQKCFVDAGVNLTSTDIADDGWPSVGSFKTTGGVLSFVLTAGGVDVSLSVAASKTEFPIVSGTAPWGWYVLVLSSEGIRDFLESGFPPPDSGLSSPASRAGDSWIRLCAKCLSQKPEELTSVRVYDGVLAKSTGPHFVLKGDIVVKPGNNMLLSEPDEENGISLNAVAGAGMGVVSCGCSQKTATRPPLFSSDGHTRLFNDTCYDIEPSVESSSKGYLKIHAKCTACCTCSMYESLVNDRIKPLADLVRKAKSDLSGLLETYESAVKRFNRRLATPTLSDVTMSLSGMSIGSNVGSKLEGSNVKGKMNRCAFTAVVRNASYATILATVYSMSGTNTIVEASAAWSDKNGDPKSVTGNDSGSVAGKTFSIYPGRSLVVTFISVKTALVAEVTTGGYTGSISVGLKYQTDGGASGSLGTLSKSVGV